MGARNQMNFAEVMRWAFMPNVTHVQNTNVPDLTPWTSPLWKLTASALLLIAVAHGVHGLVVIADDYIASARGRQIVRILSVVAILSMSVIGLYMIWLRKFNHGHKGKTFPSSLDFVGKVFRSNSWQKFINLMWSLSAAAARDSWRGCTHPRRRRLRSSARCIPRAHTRVRRRAVSLPRWATTKKTNPNGTCMTRSKGRIIWAIRMRSSS